MTHATCFLRILAGFVSLACLSLASASWPQGGKVGIFDLDAIHATPLNPEVVARSVENGLVTEAVRYTTVPGVRPLLIITYKQGLKARPGIVFARRFGAEARINEAAQGFVGVSVAPPGGNDDPQRLDAIGGPSYTFQLGYRQYFDPDPKHSWLYHHVLALTRAFDYLETRPEIDIKKTSVLGAEWPGTAVALMHAIDDRPCAYFVWNGVGFYADREGMSGDVRARISRQAYEMYSPAAYAGLGTRPIFIANALNSTDSRFDAVVEFAKGLKSPKVLAFAANRERFESSIKEFSGSSSWQAFWTNPFGAAPSIGEGSVTVSAGKLKYTCAATGQTGITLYVSYGKPGNWTGRNWYRFAMNPDQGKFTAEVPVYDPSVPLYVFAQSRAGNFGTMANVPLLISPVSLGISAPTALFPTDLLRGDDLFVATGSMGAGPLAPNGKLSARILPHWDGRIRLKGIDPALWKGAKELVVTLKGDGSPGPLNVYVAVESRNELDSERENYSMVSLLKEGEALGTDWRQFVIPLDQIFDLDRVDSIFFETGGKPLQIAGMSWR